MVRSLLVASLFGLVACHGSSGSTGPAKPHPVDYAEYELVDRFEALSRSLAAEQGDCPRFAIDLDAWVASNQDDLPSLTAEARGGTNLDATEIAKIQERIEEVLGHVMDSAKACQADASAQAAWGKFDALLQRT